MFKPVFLKQFRRFHFLKRLGYLYEAFEIREKSTSAKKVAFRDAKEDVDKICFEVPKTSDNAGGKPTLVGTLQHKTFSALIYAQDFGTTVKQSLKGTTSSKWATLTPVSCHTFVSTLNYVSLICANSD